MLLNAALTRMPLPLFADFGLTAFLSFPILHSVTSLLGPPTTERRLIMHAKARHHIPSAMSEPQANPESAVPESP